MSPTLPEGGSPFQIEVGLAYGGAPMREPPGEVVAIHERPDCGVANASRGGTSTFLWYTARVP